MFIVLEGPHGTGKTTLIRLICEILEGKGVDVLATKEPSKSPIGVFIRTRKFSKMVLAQLLAADRRYHIENVIYPSIERGCVVITDRYLPSSYVYQQHDGIPLQIIKQINTCVLIPDITVFLCASKNIITRRIDNRKKLQQNKSDIAISPSIELALYEDARDICMADGWPNVLAFQNEREEDLLRIALEICARIEAVDEK